jgi:hypothetical protein
LLTGSSSEITPFLITVIDQVDAPALPEKTAFPGAAYRMEEVKSTLAISPHCYMLGRGR